MDYVSAYPWSFGFWCFIAGYAYARWIYRHVIEAPQPLRTDISDAAIEAEVRARHRVEAIKLYRQRSGAGLVEAKAAVEAIAQRFGIRL